MRFVTIAATLLVSLAALPGLAQEEVGDPQAGAVLAAEICAECHAILPDELYSPEPRAAPFDDIANTPGRTAMALFAWMNSSHPTMPNIILEPEELRNVVAYILSLQKDAAGETDT